MRKFAEHSESGSDPNPSHPSLRKDHKDTAVRRTLQQCKETIATLLHSNSELEKQLRQKDAIIQKLVEEKQQHMLHTANCRTQPLLQQLQSAEQRERQLKQSLQQMEQRYDEIIQKHKKEIQRLGSYNRALKIDNASLREFKELYAEKKRRNGCISQSTKKEPQPNNVFRVTKVGDTNLEGNMERQFSVSLHTPNKNYRYENLKGLPSTEHSLKQFKSAQINSNGYRIPKNLFNNQVLRQIAPAQLCEPKLATHAMNSSKLVSIQKVIKRVNELLADSQEDQ